MWDAATVGPISLVVIDLEASDGPHVVSESGRLRAVRRFFDLGLRKGILRYLKMREDIGGDEGFVAHEADFLR